MKFWLSYAVTFILLGVLFSLLYYIVSPYRSITYASPVPDFLVLKNNSQATLLDLWTPIFETFASSDNKPNVEAKSVLVYDLVHDRVLFEKNVKERLPMASLTKIMTAIVALDDPAMPKTYYVHQEDLVGEDSMGLEDGEVLTKEELLYGLLMNSGNDAAEVLAHNYPTGRDGFLKAIQDKAIVLGLHDTHFSNPSGLQGDGTQFTTVSDLLIETKYALENFPLFKQIVATYEYTVPATSTHKEYYLTNETNLLTSYPGVQGVKTGYTPEAGLCLVTYYEKDGVKLIGVLLNSPNRREEMKELLDYSLGVVSIASSNIEK
jgi:D-alanyl-D-alanine carboxypeptidase